MKSFLGLALAILQPLTIGCGSNGSGRSSSSMSDCYNSVVRAAVGCLPPASAMGLLDDAGTTCTYSNGDRVTLPSSQQSGISSFVLDSAGGSLCVSYTSSDGGFVLQTPAGTVTKAAAGAITCPNGANATGEIVTGSTSDYGSGMASFTLETSEGGLPVFDCTGSP